VPRDGPVEFHWYAAEEAGLLGSLDLAGYKKDRGEKVGAMMEFVSASLDRLAKTRTAAGEDCQGSETCKRTPSPLADART